MKYFSFKITHEFNRKTYITMYFVIMYREFSILKVIYK